MHNGMLPRWSACSAGLESDEESEASWEEEEEGAWPDWLTDHQHMSDLAHYSWAQGMHPSRLQSGVCLRYILGTLWTTPAGQTDAAEALRDAIDSCHACASCSGKCDCTRCRCLVHGE